MPNAADVLLVIEVADSSLEYDREIKLPIYAKANIPEYWIVNLRDRQIEVYHTPLGDQYRYRQLLTDQDDLQAKELPLSLAVDRIFGG